MGLTMTLVRGPSHLQLERPETVCNESQEFSRLTSIEASKDANMLDRPCAPRAKLHLLVTYAMHVLSLRQFALVRTPPVSKENQFSAPCHTWIIRPAGNIVRRRTGYSF